MATLPRTQTAAAGTTEDRTDLFIVDCDVHNLPSPEDLAAHMPQRWRDYAGTFGYRTPNEMGVVRARWMGSRSDSWSPSGRPPGNDPEFAREQLLDLYGIDYSILNNVIMQVQGYNGGNQPQGLTNAVMHAGNLWTAEAWLPVDDRYYSSICIPHEDAAASVAEIEHWAGHDRFVQAIVPFRMTQPLGHRKYRPILAALAEHGMPLAMHPGNGGNSMLTGAGWPSFYYEDHVDLPQALIAHMSSLVCEGVFDELPDLKIVVQEGGWSWVTPFLWRLDRSWRQLRAEVPDLKRTPSEYVRDHFWFTTQPMEEPHRPEQFGEALELFGDTSRLLFSSDYPHWDFDSPSDALPESISPELRAGIMGLNAAALYPEFAKGPADA